MLQTEFSFILPQGYLDADGDLHREGTMRLSTAQDEIAPLRDPRVQKNPGYLIIILLARVITKLGALEQINTKVIEELRRLGALVETGRFRTDMKVALINDGPVTVTIEV